MEKKNYCVDGICMAVAFKQCKHNIGRKTISSGYTGCLHFDTMMGWCSSEIANAEYRESQK